MHYTSARFLQTSLFIAVRQAPQQRSPDGERGTGNLDGPKKERTEEFHSERRKALDWLTEMNESVTAELERLEGLAEDETI
jgi:hypothetical protein